MALATVLNKTGLQAGFDTRDARLVDVVAAAESVSAGDLTTEVRPRGEQDALGNSLAQMLVSLRGFVGGVKDHAGEIEVAAVTLEDASGQLESASHQITDAITDVAGWPATVAPSTIEFSGPGVPTGQQAAVRVTARITADPGAYLRDVMGRRSAGLAPFDPRALAAYQAALAQPGAAHGLCEDYRASAGIDLEHDREDRAAQRRLSVPLLALWGEQGVVHRCFKPLAEWRRVADDVRGGPLPCGHYIAEEAPEALLAALAPFLGFTP